MKPIVRNSLLMTGAVIAAFFIFARPSVSNGDQESLVIETKAGEQHEFSIEIADTPSEQEKGLMFRTSMAPDHGMLFEFPTIAPISFWMKDTLIPLDIIFIEADGKIVKVHANATPKSLAQIASDAPVRAVLELNGGRAAELGIGPGGMVRHRYFKPNMP